MRADVCIPFRGGEKHRERNFGFVKTWWQNLGYTVHVASGGNAGVMNRSRARNQAAALSTADVLIFADADTVGQPDLIAEAVEHAAKTGELSYPFDRFVGLSERATVDYITGRTYKNGVIKRVGPGQASPGGILAVHRDLYDFAGRYDEGFDEGWGYEDVAFARAARTLGGIRRQPGFIVHLWHPPSPERPAAIRAKTRNRSRGDLYAAADGDPEAMRTLITELWSG